VPVDHDGCRREDGAVGQRTDGRETGRTDAALVVSVGHALLVDAVLRILKFVKTKICELELGKQTLTGI
jgi:hypothetical protein